MIFHISTADPDGLAPYLPELRRIAEGARLTLHYGESTESAGTGMEVTVAIGKSGREEIAGCIRRMAEDGVDPALVDEHTFEKYLTFPYAPDLVIKTGGDHLTDFLIWQSVYSELLLGRELAALPAARPAPGAPRLPVPGPPVRAVKAVKRSDLDRERDDPGRFGRQPALQQDAVALHPDLEGVRGLVEFSMLAVIIVTGPVISLTWCPAPDDRRLGVGLGQLPDRPGPPAGRRDHDPDAGRPGSLGRRRGHGRRPRGGAGQDPEGRDSR